LKGHPNDYIERERGGGPQSNATSGFGYETREKKGQGKPSATLSIGGISFVQTGRVPGGVKWSRRRAGKTWMLLIVRSLSR